MWQITERKLPKQSKLDKSTVAFLSGGIISAIFVGILFFYMNGDKPQILSYIKGVENGAGRF